MTGYLTRLSADERPTMPHNLPPYTRPMTDAELAIYTMPWLVEWNYGAWALLTPDGRIYSETDDGVAALDLAARYTTEGKVV